MKKIFFSYISCPCIVRCCFSDQCHGFLFKECYRISLSLRSCICNR